MQHGRVVVVLRVADAAVLLLVHQDAVAGKLGHGNVQRVGGNEIGVVVEFAREAVVVAVAGGHAPCGTESNGGQRVGRPLNAHIAVPAVGAREVLADAV